MTFWALLALVSAMTAILGVFLTIYVVINNRTLKEESKNTRETINEGVRITRELIQEEAKASREILSRIEHGQTEMRKEMAEVRKEMAEARKEMAEAIKYVAQLIVSEGEKTRQAIP